MIPREWDAPLSVLGGDLSAQEWARLIGCPARDVVTRSAELMAGVRDDRIPDNLNATRVSELMDSLEDAWRIVDGCVRHSTAALWRKAMRGRIAETLASAGPLTVWELAERMDEDEQCIGKIVYRMTHHGALVRTPGGEHNPSKPMCRRPGVYSVPMG